MLNLLLPTLFYTLVISSKRPELNMCLGKAYLNFLIDYQFCPYENWISYIFCWSFSTLLAICMSNIFDAYFVYHCVQEIKQSTEETKNMLSKKAFIKRKR